jgi:cell division transport system ATP-binding protein
MIELNDVGATYGNNPVFSHLNLRIDPGERLCIVGPSGSGKTTFINLLLKNEKPSSGDIHVDGVDLWSLSPRISQLYLRAIGTILEQDTLSDIQTIEENVAFPLEIRNCEDAIITNKVSLLLQELGIAHKAKDFISTLPRGQRRLVEFARAIIASPRIFIADEPLDHLDTNQASCFINILKKINKNGTTVVICTRDSMIADELAMRTLLLKSGHLSGDTHEEKKPKIKISAVSSA